MTEIAFHFNAPDKIGYACRLLRKAHASGARIVVTADDDALLREFDVALWTFAPHEFVPHCMHDAGAMLVDESPVLLTDAPTAAPHHEVLVNLGARVPDGFERFARLVEIVGRDDADRAAARTRWRRYAEHGYALLRHDLAAGA